MYKKFVGIHIFLNNEICVELGEYRDIEEAYEGMERNDSSLIVLTETELEKVFYIANNRNTPFNKLIVINGKAESSVPFKKWQKEKERELCNYCSRRDHF